MLFNSNSLTELTLKAATAATAGAARAARGGGHDAAGVGRHGVEVAGEHHGIEIGAVRAAVPVRWLGHDSLEGFAPIFLHAEGHGEGQKFLKHLRRLDHAIEAVGFDVIEKVFEPEDAFEGARTLLRVRGHEPAEGADYDGAENPGGDKC